MAPAGVEHAWNAVGGAHCELVINCECTVSVEVATAALAPHTRVRAKPVGPVARPWRPQRSIPAPCTTNWATPKVSPGATALVFIVPCTCAARVLAGQAGSLSAMVGAMSVKKIARTIAGARMVLRIL